MEEFYPRPFPYEIPLSEYEILCKLVWTAFGDQARPTYHGILAMPVDSGWGDEDIASTLAETSREDLLKQPYLINDFDVLLLSTDAKKYFAPALMLSVSRHQDGSGYGPRALGLVTRDLDESASSQDAAMAMAMERRLAPFSTLQQVAFGKYVELYARIDEEMPAWRMFWKDRYIHSLLESSAILEGNGVETSELLESAYAV